MVSLGGCNLMSNRRTRFIRTKQKESRSDEDQVLDKGKTLRLPTGRPGPLKRATMSQLPAFMIMRIVQVPNPAANDLASDFSLIYRLHTTPINRGRKFQIFLKTTLTSYRDPVKVTGGYSQGHGQHRPADAPRLPSGDSDGYGRANNARDCQFFLVKTSDLEFFGDLKIGVTSNGGKSS